ncbi:carbonic anhydrase [Streptococcus dentasini]
MYNHSEESRRMKRNYLVLLTVLCSLVLTVLALDGQVHAHGHQQWGYTGSTSPEHWGEVTEDYQGNGQMQSPINITGATDVDLPALDLHSKASKATIENNGHTIEVSFKEPQNTLTFEGKTYTLEQFHFHAPGENEINGRSYPLEGHFVYKTKDGEITVISVLYQYGKENGKLKKIWKKLPKAVNKPSKLSKAITVNKLFPKSLDYYNFEGSLTTPPCTEGVNWIVFKTPETISKKQVNKFSKTIGFDNNRPIQDLNGREIKE